MPNEEASRRTMSATSTSSSMLLVATAVLLSSFPMTAHSFVAFDRSTSCVRRFGCSAGLVGFMFEVSCFWVKQHLGFRVRNFQKSGHSVV
jgi:hypothetical protein